MATLTEQLKFLISANADSAIRAFEATGKAAERELGHAENKIDKLGSSMTKFGAGAMVFAGVAAKSLYGLVDGASNLSETVNKVSVIFGPASDAIMEFSKDSAQSLGMSRQAALDAASTFATFGKSAGLTGDDLSGFAMDLSGLAADLASFHNARPEDVVQALGAALRGESEPMRRFGVMLNDVTLKEEAMKLGIYNGTGALNAQQKVLAAQAAILSQTSDAQGDFARTSDGMANQQRILSAQIKNLKDGIGAGMLPMVQKLVGAMTLVTGTFANLDPAIQGTIGSFAGVAVAAIGVVGAMSFMAGQAIKLKSRFIDAAGAINKFGTAAIGITAALIAVYAIYKIFDATSESGTKHTIEFTDALKENDKAMRNSALSDLATTDKIARGFLTTMGSLGLTVDDMAQYLKDTTGPAKDFYLAFGQINNATSDTKERLTRVNEVMGTTIDVSKLSEEQALDLWVQYSNLAFSVFNLRLENEKLQASDDAVATGLLGIATSGDAATEAVDDLTDSLIPLIVEFKNAIKAFEDEEALDNIGVKMGEVYEAGKKAFGSGNQEDIDAYKGLIVDLYGDVGSYITKLGDVPTEIQSKILLAMNQGDYLAVIAQFEELEKARQSKIVVDYIINSRGGVGEKPYGPALPGMARGGRTVAGQPYVVGENGPEIVMPGNATVIPNNRIGTGGNTINIYVQGADPQAVVKALQQYNRTSGPIPVNTRGN